MPETVVSGVVDYGIQFINNAPYRKTHGGKMGLRPTTISNYQNFLVQFGSFEKDIVKQRIHFKDLNRSMVASFTQWLLEEQRFSQNYAGRLLGILKTLAVDAKRNEVDVHVYIQHVSGFAQQAQQRIIHTLNFADLEKIEALTPEKKHLANARRWLILGFWLGQRVNDLLSLTQDQLRNAPNGGVYVDIVQQKTDKKITIGVIDPTALHILRHEFPYKLYPSRFNKYLKEVLKDAGINEMVRAYKFNSKSQRKEIGISPKYSVIASHDLRRSFATNFFGKIPTPVLMEMTGHSREATFMSYIGRDPNRDTVADQFMEGVLQVRKQSY